ncbi:MAG: MFS transporter [Coriobacteriia bacterium]|nr:MFS transporter [Coriobacteriia bacterium]
MHTQRITARHMGVIIACCLQCGIPIAMIISTPGIFYPIIADDMDAQTAEISAWMSVAMLSSAAFSPVIGNLLGRFRLKTMRVSAVVVAGAAMAVFSAATAPWMLWVSAAFMGYVLVLLTSLGPATLVNRWYQERVGALMGLYAAFTAIGGVVFLLVGQAIIDASGWRAAYFAFAVITWVVGLPAELLLTRERPQEYGLLPYGAALGQADEALPVAAGGAADGDTAIREANCLMRTAPFWLLFVCGFLMNLVCQINGYFPKYVMWVDEQAAAGVVAGAFVTGAVLASLCQAGSAVGKVGLGMFSDFSVRKATVALAACGAVGVACVWQVPATFLMAFGGFAFGFFIAGVLVLLPMLCRQIFGTGEVYPVIYARIAVAPTLGGAVGNIVWPYLADNLGGFDAVFGVALVFIAVVLGTALAALSGTSSRTGSTR